MKKIIKIIIAMIILSLTLITIILSLIILKEKNTIKNKLESFYYNSKPIIERVENKYYWAYDLLATAKVDYEINTIYYTTSTNYGIETTYYINDKNYNDVNEIKYQFALDDLVAMSGYDKKYDYQTYNFILNGNYVTRKSNGINNNFEKITWEYKNGKTEMLSLPFRANLFITDVLRYISLFIVMGALIVLIALVVFLAFSVSSSISRETFKNTINISKIFVVVLIFIVCCPAILYYLPVILIMAILSR